MNTSKATPTTTSKLDSIDFKNLGFGTEFSDHMLVCDYKNGAWGAPEIVPYQADFINAICKDFSLRTIYFRRHEGLQRLG